MGYRIEIRPQVEKALKKLPRPVVIAIQKAIDQLSTTPRPPSAKRLSNREEWRLRVGDYRILYLVEDDRLVVVVVKVGHRKELYR